MYEIGFLITLLLLIVAYLFNWFNFTYWILKIRIHFMLVILFLISLALVWPLVLAVFLALWITNKT